MAGLETSAHWSYMAGRCPTHAFVGVGLEEDSIRGGSDLFGLRGAAVDERGGYCDDAHLWTQVAHSFCVSDDLFVERNFRAR